MGWVMTRDMVASVWDAVLWCKFGSEMRSKEAEHAYPMRFRRSCIDMHELLGKLLVVNKRQQVDQQ